MRHTLDKKDAIPNLEKNFGSKVGHKGKGFGCLEKKPSDGLHNEREGTITVMRTPFMAFSFQIFGKYGKGNGNGKGRGGGWKSRTGEYK